MGDAVEDQAITAINNMNWYSLMYISSVSIREEYGLAPFAKDVS